MSRLSCGIYEHTHQIVMQSILIKLENHLKLDYQDIIISG